MILRVVVTAELEYDEELAVYLTRLLAGDGGMALQNGIWRQLNEALVGFDGQRAHPMDLSVRLEPGG